ncbi:MAG TPA: hypothetical protein VFF71_03245 [Luteimonas sp.]|nr:hypothetical protein [Luteimonas sp.]
MTNANPSIAASCAVLLVLACAACSRPEPVPASDPPEPQATQLRDAVQAPIDRAKAVQDTVEDAAVKQKAAIEAAGG